MVHNELATVTSKSAVVNTDSIGSTGTKVLVSVDNIIRVIVMFPLHDWSLSNIDLEGLLQEYAIRTQVGLLLILNTPCDKRPVCRKREFDYHAYNFMIKVLESTKRTP
jgi:hypothetical protein